MGLTRSPSPRARAIGALAVLVAGSALLAATAFRGVTATADVVAPGHLRAARAVSRQFDCLSREIAQRYPSSTRAFVSVGDDAWQQRLTTLAYPLVRVVTRAHADVGIAVETAPRGQPSCGGLRLVEIWRR